jgi:hypothetical protein
MNYGSALPFPKFIANTVLSRSDASMRAAFGLQLVALLAVATPGCATSAATWRSSLARSSQPVPEANVADAEKPKETAPLPVPVTEKTPLPGPAKEDSPFVAERDKSKTGSSTPTAEKKSDPHESSTVAADSPTNVKPSSGTAPMAFSAEILQLIDAELRDATPEERAHWYEQLKKVEPAVIPEILRARRMSLQVAQQAAKTSLEPASDPAQVHGAVPLRRRIYDPSLASGTQTPLQPAGFQYAAPTYASPTDGAGSDILPIGHQTLAGSRPTEERSDSRPSSPPAAFGREQDAPISTGTPIVVQRQPSPSAPDARGTGFSEPGTVPMPWPPPKSAPPGNNRQNLTQPLAFGAGLVQNVVGLVPNRGTSLTVQPNASAAPASLPAASDDGWQTELTQAIALLEQELAAQRTGGETDLRKHVALRLMYLVADQQERALTAIPGLDPAEQEFWQQVMWGLSNGLDTEHIVRPEDRAAQTIAQLNAAVRRLQEKADLQIRNVAFSKQNLGYGNYERFPRDEFRPGHEVLLYAEMENFKSEPTADGQYRTLLRSTIEILSPSGELRKKIDFPATEDLCRNYRRDYFHNYQFTIPDRLPLGPHVLKLTVFDELSGKMASYSLNFLVN